MYFDHSATSFPKPQELFDEILAFQKEIGGSPGRGVHEAAERASSILFDTRLLLASLFSAPDPNRIVFTSNATESLNLALLGLLREGDHVVTTCVEHNSVIRPLHHLRLTRNVHATFVPCDSLGMLDPSDVAGSIRPETRLVVINHASNVTGAIQPIEEIGSRLGHIPMLVDASQTAGIIPIDVQRMNIAMLAFTGHKSLYGPTGIGGLYLREDQNPTPLKWGGTGTFSEDPRMPSALPERYECGTVNMLGIAGLRGGLRFIERVSTEAIRSHGKTLADRLMAGIEERKWLKAYGPADSEARTGTVSLRVEGWEPSEVSFLLDQRFAIATRSGLHCAPLVHRCIGTFPEGTVRVSVGFFNTIEEIDALLRALDELRTMRTH